MTLRDLLFRRSLFHLKISSGYRPKSVLGGINGQLGGIPSKFGGINKKVSGINSKVRGISTKTCGINSPASEPNHIPIQIYKMTFVTSFW